MRYTGGQFTEQTPTFIGSALSEQSTIQTFFLARVMAT
jgi:hypothetical protein